MFDLICSRNIYHESRSPWIVVLTVTNPNQPTCKYALIPQKLQQEQFNKPKKKKKSQIELGIQN